MVVWPGFSTGPVDVSDAEECVKHYNEIIHALFEKCIGDKLREEMNKDASAPKAEGD